MTSDSASEPALGLPPVRTSLFEWCWPSLLETSQYSFDYGGQTDLYWADTAHPALRSPSPLSWHFDTRTPQSPKKTKNTVYFGRMGLRFGPDPNFVPTNRVTGRITYALGLM